MPQGDVRVPFHMLAQFSSSTPLEAALPLFLQLQQRVVRRLHHLCSHVAPPHSAPHTLSCKTTPQARALIFMRSRRKRALLRSTTTPAQRRDPTQPIPTTRHPHQQGPRATHPAWRQCTCGGGPGPRPHPSHPPGRCAGTGGPTPQPHTCGRVGSQNRRARQGPSQLGRLGTRRGRSGSFRAGASGQPVQTTPRAEGPGVSHARSSCQGTKPESQRTGTHRASEVLPTPGGPMKQRMGARASQPRSRCTATYCRRAGGRAGD